MTYVHQHGDELRAAARHFGRRRFLTVTGRRGYVTIALGEDSARADFRTVAAVTTPGAPVTTAASYVTEAGDPGLKPA
ncbi:hypothetical protein [Streptomyces vilmorinianum]|uniref:hypothetical protein n=1 Tax=Streptomyces vilmorinianum TaxID=3051092 RepID=UPI0010FB5A2B|nr:hypothetical protein [Streptomyces vilmorinianum]